MLFWNLFGKVAKIIPEISQHILKTIYHLLLLKELFFDEKENPLNIEKLQYSPEHTHHYSRNISLSVKE